MAALLEWADDDAPAPPPRPAMPVLSPGELPPAAEAAIWRWKPTGLAC